MNPKYVELKIGVELIIFNIKRARSGLAEPPYPKTMGRT